jgi:hypothetical protein
VALRRSGAEVTALASRCRWRRTASPPLARQLTERATLSESLREPSEVAPDGGLEGETPTLWASGERAHGRAVLAISRRFQGDRASTGRNGSSWEGVWLPRCADLEATLRRSQTEAHRRQVAHGFALNNARLTRPSGQHNLKSLPRLRERSPYLPDSGGLRRCFAIRPLSLVANPGPPGLALFLRYLSRFFALNPRFAPRFVVEPQAGCLLRAARAELDAKRLPPPSLSRRIHSPRPYWDSQTRNVETAETKSAKIVVASCLPLIGSCSVA